MKDRNHKGQFRGSETSPYKHKKKRPTMGEFNEKAKAEFEEAALERYDFKQGGCPDGFRSKGSQTISGKRREVCCTPDGKICMTADGIPL